MKNNTEFQMESHVIFLETLKLECFSTRECYENQT